MEAGNADLTQLLIDRMERVGLPPFNDVHISLHFLLNIFKPLDLRVNENDRTYFNDLKLNMACQFADAIYGQHIIPYQFIEDVIRYCETHPLVSKLLRICEMRGSPESFFTFFLLYIPTDAVTLECLKLCLLHLTVAGAPEEAKQDLLSQVIRKGDVASYLAPHILMDNVSPNFLQHINHGGVVKRRTSVMQCFECPPSLDSLKLLLKCPTLDPNVLNENGLNVLQQCVVDIISNPFDYAPLANTYGEMFCLIIEAGVIINVEMPAFYTSLFSYVSKLEMGQLAYPLFGGTAKANAILNSTDNMLSLMVNYGFDRVAKSLGAPFHGSPVLLEARFSEPDQSLFARDLPFLFLPSAAIITAMSFCDIRSLISLSKACLRLYWLSLADSLWVLMIDKLTNSFSVSLSPTPLLSRKLVCRAKVTGRVPHLFVKMNDESKMVCLFTGETLNTAGSTFSPF